MSRRDPFTRPDTAMKEYQSLGFRTVFVDVNDDGAETIQKYTGDEFRLVGSELALIRSAKSLGAYVGLQNPLCYWIDEATGERVHLVSSGVAKASLYEVDGLTIQTFANISPSLSWFLKPSDLIKVPPYAAKTFVVPPPRRFQLTKLPPNLRLQLAQHT